MPRLMARLGSLAVQVWHNGGLYRELVPNAAPGSADAAQSANRAIVQLVDADDTSEDRAVQVTGIRSSRGYRGSGASCQPLTTDLHCPNLPTDCSNRLGTIRVCV